jgi:lipoprotein-anchoring transpeptidase ErfK/SrfK
MVYFAPLRRSARKHVLIITSILLFSVLFSACGGAAPAQQKATSAKSHLDSLLAHARDIGIPSSKLQTIVTQEQQISSTQAPFTLFSDQPAIDYYGNVARRYQILAIEVSSLEAQITEETASQAYSDMHSFETALAQRQSQQLIEAKIFASQFAQDQSLLANAQYPKEYQRISADARHATQALSLMGSAYDDLQSLSHTAQQLQASHVDTTALTQAENDDLELFRAARTAGDFTHLLDLINVQLQEANVLALQDIPYFGAYEGAIKLQELSAAISEMRTYNGDVSTFQQRLNTDQQNLATAKGYEYINVLEQIDSDIASMQIPLAHAQAVFYLNRFQQEVDKWGSHNQYKDRYDNNSYRLDYEYDQQGIGADVVAAVQTAQTVDDYQAAIDMINNYLFHLQSMEVDAYDRTPWDQSHIADRGLLRRYHLTTGTVIVVSLAEQALRFYQNGQLVNAFHVTTGQYARPTPPGLWSIFLRQHPTEFKSSDPKGSAFWYPPTKIEYAMEYHGGGYFFHDSWWRADYGIGTNFPHYDSGGDETFAGNGSHGCINMVPDDAAWLYNHTSYGTAVIIY